MSIQKYFMSAIYSVLLLAPLSANAIVITVSDFSTLSDGSDAGSTLFQVTETFTSAAELGGTQNRYEYTVENLTADLTASLFRVANPDNVTDYVMTGPTGWDQRLGIQNFLWETATDILNPGDALSGFMIETSNLLVSDLSIVDPGSVYPGIGTYGWIMAAKMGTDMATRVDVFATSSVSRIVSVPEPESFLLFAMGMLMMVFSLRSVNNKS